METKIAMNKAGFYYDAAAVTNDQPFPGGLLGCKQFRIPGLIRLDNGHLFAVSDARWSCAKNDFGGIDTMFAVSEDNGKTWSHGFAAYFPDSADTPADPLDTTTCIDADIVQAADGAIHLFVNMNPTGVTTGLTYPLTGTGFIEIGGKKRLCVVRDYADANTAPTKLPREKVLYVGDADDSGFSPVLTADGTATGYTVDSYFNIYRDGELLWQKQVDTDARVAQNLFYRDSELHVYNTSFTMHIVTRDEGKTWRNELLPPVKTESESGVITSPGNALRMSSGFIAMPFYVWHPEDNKIMTFLVVSRDDGKTFTRTSPIPATVEIPWSTEAKPVEIDADTIRVFFRNEVRRICYADWHVAADKWDDPVSIPGIGTHSDCNYGAAREGDIIYVSAPLGVGPECLHRMNGHLLSFALGKDGSMTLTKDTIVTPDAFSYSVVTPLEGGKAAVLWDTCDDGFVWYKEIDTNN